jgi:hypothetical protein
VLPAGDVAMVRRRRPSAAGPSSRDPAAQRHQHRLQQAHREQPWLGFGGAGLASTVALGNEPAKAIREFSGAGGPRAIDRSTRRTVSAREHADREPRGSNPPGVAGQRTFAIASRSAASPTGHHQGGRDRRRSFVAECLRRTTPGRRQHRTGGPPGQGGALREQGPRVLDISPDAGGRSRS